MKQPGQVAILKFPQTDLALGKPRPVLLIARLPGPYDDWLVSMISTQLQQAIEGFDEVIDQGDDDFHASGLKISSVIRISRLASDKFQELTLANHTARLQRIEEKVTDHDIRIEVLDKTKSGKHKPR